MSLVKVKCDQCSALMINGVFCHELGCPNMGARWDVEEEQWVKQRTCVECGQRVDEDDLCCMAFDELDAEDPESVSWEEETREDKREAYGEFLGDLEREEGW